MTKTILAALISVLFVVNADAVPIVKELAELFSSKGDITAEAAGRVERADYTWNALYEEVLNSPGTSDDLAFLLRYIKVQPSRKMGALRDYQMLYESLLLEDRAHIVQIVGEQILVDGFIAQVRMSNLPPAGKLEMIHYVVSIAKKVPIADIIPVFFSAAVDNAIYSTYRQVILDAARDREADLLKSAGDRFVVKEELKLTAALHTAMNTGENLGNALEALGWNLPSTWEADKGIVDNIAANFLQGQCGNPEAVMGKFAVFYGVEKANDMREKWNARLKQK